MMIQDLNDWRTNPHYLKADAVCCFDHLVQSFQESKNLEMDCKPAFVLLLVGGVGQKFCRTLRVR
jgi:hypothetical protein